MSRPMLWKKCQDVPWASVADLVSVTPKTGCDGIYDRAPVYERVLRHCVQREDGCLVWSGSSQLFGPDERYRYARIKDDSGKLKFVHRVAWEHHNGLAPAGHVVARKCREPLCCNHDHMFIIPRKKLHEL